MTKPGPSLKKQKPIQTERWDEKHPCFLEADAVTHCYSSVAGENAHTIYLVDIAGGGSLPTRKASHRHLFDFGESHTDELKKYRFNLSHPNVMVSLDGESLVIFSRFWVSY